MLDVKKISYNGKFSCLIPNLLFFDSMEKIYRYIAIMWRCFFNLKKEYGKSDKLE